MESEIIIAWVVVWVEWGEANGLSFVHIVTAELVLFNSIYF